MVKSATLIVLTLMCSGCSGTYSAVPSKEKTSRIEDFDEIADNLGRYVELDGFISSAHEAKGLYFRRSDIEVLNRRCVAISPEIPSDHQTHVRVVGKLVKSECAGERICITACDRFTLVR